MRHLKPMSDLRALDKEQFCYLTTTGRVTGRPHNIEIWFSLSGETLYMLSDSHSSDWVENLRRAPRSSSVSPESASREALASSKTEEDELARRLLIEKYESKPGSLSSWRRTALPVAVDLQPAAAP